MVRTVTALAPLILLAACEEPASQATEAPPAGPPHIVAESELAAGEYLVTIGGCDDCHTAQWAETNGNVPLEDRLLGVPIGYKGPWGTSYPNNLRLVAAAYTPDEWVEMMQTRQGLPPMPWPAINTMHEADLRAIHAYLTSLGDAGEAMPGAVPPDVEPSTPYYYFMPVGPSQGGTPVTLP